MINNSRNTVLDIKEDDHENESETDPCYICLAVRMRRIIARIRSIEPEEQHR